MKAIARPRPFVGALLAFLTSPYARAAQPPDPTASDAYGNTAGGTNALLNLVTPSGGFWNTAFGDHALTSNTTGSDNTAFGIDALNLVTTGNENTAVGTLALGYTTGDDNTAVGSSALVTNMSGHDNTAVGYAALFDNGSGYSNVAIGSSSLLNSTTGHNNIAIGDSAGSALSSGSNNIYIATIGKATESNALRIADGGSVSKVYIGGISGVTVASGVDVVIGNGQQLGTVVSSERYKKDISDMGDASSKLMRLRPVTFLYKSDDTQRLQYGLIAEEVARVYPELVARDDQGQPEAVIYHELAPMLLNEAEKQASEIAKQSKEIAELRAVHEKDVAVLSDLRQMFAAQNAALTKLQAEVEPQIRVAAR